MHNYRLLSSIIQIRLSRSNNSLKVVDNKEECSIMRNIENSSNLARPARCARTWPAMTFVLAAILGVLAGSNSVSAQSFSVADQTSCKAIPLAGGTATWSGSTCTIPAGATLNLSGTLTVAPQATLKVSGTINSSGTILNFGKIVLSHAPKGRIVVNSGGSLVNKFAAKIISNGVIAIKTGATLVNSGFLHNQFASTLTVGGTLKGDNGVMSLSVSNTYSFTGTLELNGTNYHDITLNGVVLVRIAAKKLDNNMYNLVVCDYDKNIDGVPDHSSIKIGSGQASSVCTANKPAIVASVADVARVILVQDDDPPLTVASTNTNTGGTTTISSSTTSNKNARSATLSGQDRYLGGTG
jgi:hypothetical protein